MQGDGEGCLVEGAGSAGEGAVKLEQKVQGGVEDKS